MLKSFIITSIIIAGLATLQFYVFVMIAEIMNSKRIEITFFRYIYVWV